MANRWVNNGNIVSLFSLFFILLGSKVVLEGDCSQEMKMLAPWKKAMTNLCQSLEILKSCVYARSVTQSCLTLCNPVDCSLPGSSIHGILQARILKDMFLLFNKNLLTNPIILCGSGSSKTFLLLVLILLI